MIARIILIVGLASALFLILCNWAAMTLQSGLVHLPQ